MRAFVFYEACSPLPMGEGPGVRSGFKADVKIEQGGAGDSPAQAVRANHTAARQRLSAGDSPAHEVRTNHTAATTARCDRG